MYIVSNTSNRIISFRLNQKGETLSLPIGAVVKVEKDKIDSLGESNLTKLGDYLTVEKGVGVKTTEDIKAVDNTQKEEYEFSTQLDKAETVEELKENFGKYITNNNIKNIQKLKKHILENKYS
jgi:hypothetical protein